MSSAREEQPTRSARSRGEWALFLWISVVLSLALVVALAALFVLPVRTSPRVGVATAALLMPEQRTTWAPSRNLTIPSGATISAVVAQWTTGGNYSMNLTIGTCLFQGCLPPTTPLLYSATNASNGGFGWACGHPWYCEDTYYEVDPTQSSDRSWTLSWEVYYNFTASTPLV